MDEAIRATVGVSLLIGAFVWLVFCGVQCMEAYTHCEHGVVVKDYLGVARCVELSGVTK